MENVGNEMNILKGVNEIMPKTTIAIAFLTLFFLLFCRISHAITISNVQISNITQTSATVSWTTDVAGDSQVQYGDANSTSGSDYETNTPLQNTNPRVTSHTVNLTNLYADVIWVIRIRSADAAGNLAVEHETNCNFRTTKPSCTSGFDYVWLGQGTHHVVRGYDFYVGLVGQASCSGATNEIIDVTVTGMPTGMTFAGFPSGLSYQTAGFLWWDSSGNIRFSTTSSVIPGDYTITITGNSRTTHRIHTITYDITVEDLPSAPTKTSYTPPALNASTLASWVAHMQSYGRTYCANADTSEGGVWYYDGERVYFQIRDYATQQGWNTSPYRPQDWDPCAQNSEALYENNVLFTNCGVGGWRIFPHGLYEDYVRNGDTASRDRVETCFDNAAYVNLGGNVLVRQSRETAYTLDYYVVKEKAYCYNQSPCTNPHRHSMFSRALEYAMGHLDQWTNSATVQRVPSFMVALTAEALIKYYDWANDNNNPNKVTDSVSAQRVFPLIQTAADWLWTNSWKPNHSTGEGFLYEANTPDMTTTDVSPDLNNLIAAMYAWVYLQTGNPTYRTEAEAIWKGGVDHAWLGAGKQFSQNYRLSFDTVNWMTTTVTGGSNTTPPAAPTGLTVN